MLETENSTTDNTTGYNEALKGIPRVKHSRPNDFNSDTNSPGIQVATDALTILKEKKESLKLNVKPRVEQEFYQSANIQKKEDEANEVLSNLVDERLRLFKETWQQENKTEITKLKQFIDSKFDDIEKSVFNRQEKFEDKLSEQIKDTRNKDDASNDKLDLLEVKLIEVLNKEIKQLEQKQNEGKTEAENYISEFEKKLSQNQDKLRQDLRSEFNEGFSNLQAEIRQEIERLNKVSQAENEAAAKHTHKDPKYEQSRDLVEDVFDMKMQSEMNEMKNRLREDFSREVMALEDEIEALRKSHETRDYTTDEGENECFSISNNFFSKL